MALLWRIGYAVCYPFARYGEMLVAIQRHSWPANSCSKCGLIGDATFDRICPDCDICDPFAEPY